MANASTTGFGLRAVMTVGNTPATSGQSEYFIQTSPGVGSYKGDPVSVQNSSGNQGFVQDASFTTTDDTGAGGTTYNNTTSALLIGVFNGFFYISSNGKPTFANSVDASTATSVNYNTGSNNITAFVIDNSNQEYVIKADAALGTDAATAQAKFGAVNQMNTNNYTASSNIDGQSITTLDIGSAATTAMFTLVRSANDPENSDLTAAGSNIIVKIAKSSSLYN